MELENSSTAPPTTTMVTTIATRSSIMVKPCGDCLPKRCMAISLLKARYVSTNGVIPGAAGDRKYLYGHSDLPNVWTDIPGRIGERLNKNLPTEITQRKDHVARGPKEAVFPGENV